MQVTYKMLSGCLLFTGLCAVISTWYFPLISADQYVTDIVVDSVQEQGESQISPDRARASQQIPQLSSHNVNFNDFYIAELLATIAGGYALSENQVTTIEQMPQPFASELIKAPESLAKLLSSYFHDEDEHQLQLQQRAAQVIYASLSNSQKQTLGNYLATSEIDLERKVALKLLSSQLHNNEARLDGFYLILQREPSPRILSQAINLSRSVSGIANKQKTLEALAQGIATSYSEYTTGQAFVAMAQLDLQADLVDSQVISGLRSYSKQIRASALRATDIILKNQITRIGYQRNMQENQEYLFVIQSIIDDPFADANHQNQAHLLIDRYFSEAL